MWKKGLATLTLGILGGLAGAFFMTRYVDQPISQTGIFSETTPVYRVNNQAYSLKEADFIEASKVSTPTVVFIKTESEMQVRSSFWFFDFDPFGQIGKVSSTGSGVILSSDGYIVTNHHVVKNADKIEVVLSQRKTTYTATLIGADPSTDLALLKIEAKNLPFVELANSDQLQIGEWVLAVGNPFNLTSTVTAGIVSAKGRNISVVDNNFPIESFIQTDAAINPGNSGGALVNLKGQLVGVNTAIASKTGSYVGYGFAIPANIVAKIVNDLKEFGQTQRGFAGVEVVDIDGKLSAKLGDQVQNGVYVSRVNENNDDAKRALKAGDVILKVDNQVIESKANFDEQLSYHRPGDIIHLVILRDGAKLEKDLKLVNQEGNTELLRKQVFTSESLGADFEPISKIEKDLYGISNGFKVSNIKNGKIRKMNIQEGFIFTAINKQTADNVKEFVELLEEITGQVRIEGVSPGGGKQFMSFYIY
jgi:S1-C subfamily serine protease